MIHLITPLPENSNFYKILEIQIKIMESICGPDISSVDINLIWLRSLLPNEDDKLIEKMSTVKDKVAKNGKTFFENAQIIADLPLNKKSEIINDFKSDLQFSRLYDLRIEERQEGKLRGLQSLQEADIRIARLAFRGLLECFYDPMFYKDQGFDIRLEEGQVIILHKDGFIEEFQGRNQNVLVCPYCDGAYTDVQVDHYIAKSEFPALSCHPLNLIPVCAFCNKAPNKGQKKVFDPNNNDSTADWFHPYLRSASGLYQISLFDADQTLAPHLTNQDIQIQRRIDNFANLINLNERWKKEIKRIIQQTLRDIYTMITREKIVPTKDLLLLKLDELAAFANGRIGVSANSMLEHAYLQAAANNTPNIIDELWAYCEGLL